MEWKMEISVWNIKDAEWNTMEWKTIFHTRFRAWHLQKNIYG